MSKWISHVVLDVEADGPAAGLYNMISFAMVSLADPAHAFMGEVAPILDDPGIDAARRVTGISFDVQRGYRDPLTVMREARDWLHALADGKRTVIWSDNPAFDWQYWNLY